MAAALTLSDKVAVLVAVCLQLGAFAKDAGQLVGKFDNGYIGFEWLSQVGCGGGAGGLLLCFCVDCWLGTAGVIMITPALVSLSQVGKVWQLVAHFCACAACWLLLADVTLLLLLLLLLLLRTSQWARRW
jgi:hypothetical protein